MWTALRSAVVALVFLTASFSIFCTLSVLSVFFMDRKPTSFWDVRSLSLISVAFSSEVALANLAWKKLGTSRQKFGAAPPRGALSTAGLWSLVAGTTGLVGGTAAPFIYCFLFDPTGNPIPLIGIVFTGPLGFIFGGIAGLIRGALRRR